MKKCKEPLLAAYGTDIRKKLINGIKRDLKRGRHTPGPWHLDATNCIHRSGDDPDRTLLAAIRFMGGDNAEGIANARLMAAAPELLDALEQAEKEIRWQHDLHTPMFKGKVGEPDLAVARQARKAINKARGKA